MSSSRRFDLQLIEKTQSIQVEDTELKVVVVSKLNKSFQTGIISRHRAQLIPEFILLASQVKILLLGLLSLYTNTTKFIKIKP